MRNNVLFVAVGLVIAGCTSPTAPADPVGTVTTDLRTGTSIRFLTGSTAAAPFDLSIDASLNFQGMIAGVGPVQGVGEITTVPASGFVQSFSAATGSGFVVKTKDGLNLYYAVYVDADIISTSGGVLGKTIKWHSLTTLDSIAVTPAGASITRPAPGVGACAFSAPLAFAATGTNSDGSTNNVTSLVTWSSSPTPDGGNSGPFLKSTGIATASGSSTQPNGCPLTPLGSYTISAAYSVTGTTGSTMLTIQ